MYQAHRAGLRFNSRKPGGRTGSPIPMVRCTTRDRGGRYVSYRYRTRELDQISPGCKVSENRRCIRRVSQLKSRVQDYAPDGNPRRIQRCSRGPELSAANESAGRRPGEGERPDWFRADEVEARQRIDLVAARSLLRVCALVRVLAGHQLHVGDGSGETRQRGAVV